MTERTGHLEAIGAALEDQVGNLFTLHGRTMKKLRLHAITIARSNRQIGCGSGLEMRYQMKKTSADAPCSREFPFNV